MTIPYVKVVSEFMVIVLQTSARFGNFIISNKIVGQGKISIAYPNYCERSYLIKIYMGRLALP
jgi:hypothetical protein